MIDPTPNEMADLARPNRSEYRKFWIGGKSLRPLPTARFAERGAFPRKTMGISRQDDKIVIDLTNGQIRLTSAQYRKAVVLLEYSKSMTPSDAIQKALESGSG